MVDYILTLYQETIHSKVAPEQQDLAPSYLANLLIPYVPIPFLRSSDGSVPVIPVGPAL